MKKQNERVSRKNFFSKILKDFGIFIEEIFGDSLDQFQKKFPMLIRPPGALLESKFTKLCSRCGECIKACPYIALQPVINASEFDRGTPCLRVGTSYCRFCADFPCINACQTGALILKEGPRKIGTAVPQRSKCLRVQDVGCDACKKICDKTFKAISFAGKNQEPAIDKNVCSGCGACLVVCPVTPHPAINLTNE